MRKWIVIISSVLVLIAALITGYFVFSVRGIELTANIVNLEEGGVTEISCTLIPDNALFGKEVKWSSSDVSVARVSDGKITAMSAGECVITAKAGKYHAECHVTVRSARELQELMIDKLSEYVKEHNDIKNDSDDAFLMQIGEEGNIQYMLAVKDKIFSVIAYDQSNGYVKQTMLLFERGNLQRVNVNSTDTFSFDGDILKTRSKGGIIPGSYVRGGHVDIENISMDSASDDFEIGVTDEYQAGVDKATENALNALENYLKEHPDLGNMKTLGF